jgi:beta-ureidopropionase
MASKDTMRISLIQISLTSDVRENQTSVLGFMGQAASQGADLVLTPELCLSPFFPQHPGRDVSQYEVRIDDEIVSEFQAACKKLKLMASPNLYLVEDRNRYDASLLIDTKGELLGVSKMVHICQAPYFYEQDYYTPSDTGFKVYDTDICKIGIVICFDRHMPESIRTCVLRGAQIILIPTANTSREPRELFEWELRVAAMQNGVFIVCCNRVGIEDDMEFYGESIIIDPNGNIVAKADGSEQILSAEIDLSLVDVARKTRPYLALLRPETYE